jgi:hypothetical protein
VARAAEKFDAIGLWDGEEDRLDRDRLLTEIWQIEPMISWRHTPDDEVTEVIEKVLDAYEAVTRALAAAEVRLDDEQTKATVEKMIEHTKGRSEREIAAARKLAARKRAKTDIGLGETALDAAMDEEVGKRIEHEPRFGQAQARCRT